jgi:NitT/TauT family transport system permease protein
MADATLVEQRIQARQRTGNHLADIGLPVLTLCLLVVAWQLTTWLYKVPVWLLPSPIDVTQTSIKWASILPAHTAVTLYETLVGFAVAIVIGLPTAVLIAYSPIMQRTIYPIVLASQSVPKVALAPLLLMWVGYGQAPKIIIVFLVCFFPIVVSSISGMNAVPAAMIDLVRSLSASPMQVFLKIRLPSAMPYIFVGLKVAVIMAVTGAVVGEFVAASAGLGYLILMSTQQFNTALAFASMFILTAMSIILFYSLDGLEHLVVPWANK